MVLKGFELLDFSGDQGVEAVQARGEALLFFDTFGQLQTQLRLLGNANVGPGPAP